MPSFQQKKERCRNPAGAGDGHRRQLAAARSGGGEGGEGVGAKSRGFEILGRFGVCLGSMRVKRGAVGVLFSILFGLQLWGSGLITCVAQLPSCKPSAASLCRAILLEAGTSQP